MKVHVDFSVFIASLTESEAYGYIHGMIVLPTVPSVGDEILFMESLMELISAHLEVPIKKSMKPLLSIDW